MVKFQRQLWYPLSAVKAQLACLAELLQWWYTISHAVLLKHIAVSASKLQAAAISHTY